jgi:phosphate starvation-inducible protein PhoH and related proteins
MSRRRTRHKRRSNNAYDLMDENIIEFEKYYGKTLYIKKPNIKLQARSTNQRDYIDLLLNQHNTIVFASGPAGTGKTMLACLAALKALSENKIDKIVLTRPAVEVDEQHGFLPGTIQQKMEPWTRPIFDVFKEYYSLKNISRMIDEDIIEISPLAYMRGRTFKRAFIIADEMQNATRSQMKMLLTRIGDDSRMVVTGDLNQSDRMRDNGLHEFQHLLNRYNADHIRSIEFEQRDIRRHIVVEEVLRIYGDEN